MLPAPRPLAAARFRSQSRLAYVIRVRPPPLPFPRRASPVVSASPLICPAVIAVVQVPRSAASQARRHVDAGWAWVLGAEVWSGPRVKVPGDPVAGGAQWAGGGRGTASWKPISALPGCRGDFPAQPSSKVSYRCADETECPLGTLVFALKPAHVGGGFQWGVRTLVLGTWTLTSPGLSVLWLKRSCWASSETPSLKMYWIKKKKSQELRSSKHWTFVFFRGGRANEWF